ncbi:enolase 4 [Turdus rufiventris]|nr:enolase 4 [Turdus rufiventris]
MEAGEQRARLRREAAEYYRGLRVPERMEQALNELFLQRPEDLYGELANYFSKFSKAPVICKLVGRKLFNGVGQPTLEVEIYCTVKNCEKRICSTVMATHSQIPENALPEIIEADEKERNESVHTAVEWVNEPLNTMLRHLDPTDQCQADKMLGEYFENKVEEKKEIERQEKERQEEEAAKATPSESPKEMTLPLPMVTLLNCEKNSPTKLKLVKEVMVIPPVELSLKEGIKRVLDIQKEIIRLLESSGKKEKGKYEILTGAFKSPDEMVTMYVEMIHNFPFIIALIDPLRKEDREQWSSICFALGSKCYVIAEDAATQISKLKTEQNINIARCSGVVLKYINQTKVSDLLELTGILDGQRHITILGSPDGESSDESLVDLAVGLGARFLKLGGLSRGERVAKYNRLLAIEEELAANGALRTSFFLTLFSACHEYGHKDWREND